MSATRPQQCQDIMTTDPVCCVPGDTVADAARMMQREDIGAVPVVNNHQQRQLVGIITDRDLALGVVAAGRDPHQTEVGTVMTRDLVTCYAEDALQQAMRVMLRAEVRRLPIVDHQQRLVGIIAQADLVTGPTTPTQTAALVEHIAQPAASNGKPQPARPSIRSSPSLRRRARRTMQPDLKLLGGLALGLGVMYLFDPERGKRRRNGLLDQAHTLLGETEQMLGTTMRDLSNRAQGLLAETQARLTEATPDDQVLAERVRSAMGHVVAYPRSIEVTADQGRVTLRGRMLAEEVDNLLATVACVRGVAKVVNELEAQQSTARPMGQSAPADAPLESRQAAWSPTTRLLMGFAGGTLLGLGLQRRDLPGLALGTLGVAALVSAATGGEPARLPGVGGERRTIDIQKTINIGAPVEQVFAFWRDYENFPRFMSHLRQVKDLGGGRSRWVVEGPGGFAITWEAVITQFVPDELLAWKSEPGATVPNAGIVRFETNADGSTRVHIKLSYQPPAGTLGHAIARLLSADPRSKMNEDLVRFKSLIEQGKTSTPEKTVTREDIEFSQLLKPNGLPQREP